MNKKDAMKWVNALRSGEYKQGEPGTLKSETGFCCLGVLCEINGLKPELKEGRYHYGGLGNFGALPSTLMKKLNMYNSLGVSRNNDFSLYELNDRGIHNGEHLERFTFDEIADIIQVCYEDL